MASKLNTGKTPEILEAIAFSPREPQKGLRAVSIAGNPKYRIDPLKDDFFRRLIDLREAIKTKLKDAHGAERDRLAADQLTLKIIASATSYGITAEVNVSDLGGFEWRTAYGAGSEPFKVETNKSEEPGIYFHPMLAAFITGAARLNLAIVERLTVEKGLDWAFCDTDSMAIAKPPEMNDAEFMARAKSICAWFEPLKICSVQRWGDRRNHYSKSFGAWTWSFATALRRSRRASLHSGASHSFEGYWRGTMAI